MCVFGENLCEIIINELQLLSVHLICLACVVSTMSHWNGWAIDQRDIFRWKVIQWRLFVGQTSFRLFKLKIVFLEKF